MLNRLLKWSHYGSRVYPLIKEVLSLRDEEIHEMILLMENYYDNLDRRQFYQDLSEKTKVILVICKESGGLAGFSTISTFDLREENAIGAFSGDTIVSREFWGATALQVGFGAYLCSLKWRHPSKSIYWFLVSKGYKTYLLMTKNFHTHYPSYRYETPKKVKRLMDKVYAQLYPNTYNRSRGLIETHGDYYLRHGIASPDLDAQRHSPDVRYFLKSNPRWQQGYELCCLAEMNVTVLIRYLTKKAFRSRRRKPRSSKQGIRYAKT